MKKNLFYVIFIIIILAVNIPVFSAQPVENPEINQNPDKTQDNSLNKKENIKLKKAPKRTRVKLSFISAGMKAGGFHQNAFSTPPDFDNDVKFFGYELNINLQYLFKDVLFNLFFEYSDFKTKMHYSNTSSGEFTSDDEWYKKAINFRLGYVKRFSEKYVLVFPSIGFGYQDHKNLGSNKSHRTEIYYLILDSRFFIEVNKSFELGFDLNVRLLLSHVATFTHATNGEGTSVLRKGIFLNFSIPMKFNLSRRFFISFEPFFNYFHQPDSTANHINLDTGNKVQVSYNEMHTISGGSILSFGVYF